MRVLLIINRLLQGGGTETHVVTLAEELRRRGHQVGIFTTGGPWTLKAKRCGAQVHRCKFTPRELRRVVTRNQYNVVHAHDGPGFRLVSRTALPLKVRVILTVHGTYIARAVIRGCLKRANRFIAVSPVMYSYAKGCGVPTSKLSFIENGVAVSRFQTGTRRNLRKRLGIPTDAKVIGYAARFTLRKAVLGRRIVGILSSYTTSHRNTWVLVAGRASNRIVANSQRRRVLGHVEDMQSFYGACDVLVGAGRVALESLASGTPTVAVGMYSYVGPVVPSSWSMAVKRNFGDHGLTMLTWTNPRLRADVHKLLHPTTRLQSDLNNISHRVRARYSDKTIVGRIERLYRSN